MKNKLLVTILCLSAVALAGEHLEENDIWVAVKRAEHLATKYGPERVLFASDLDNTLLKTRQDLGSEPWFNWQDSLLKETPDKYRIACDFPDLLHFFYFAIELSQLTAVQPDQDKAISHLQNLGVATVIVTARGEPVASQTFRELGKNNLHLYKTSLLGNGYPTSHYPYDLENPGAAGLSQTDVAKFKLGKSRPVLYQRGVLFSDGQNKGILLRTLIHKTKKPIKAIVFWDNDKKNTQRVLDAFEGKGIEVFAYRASRMDADIQRFADSDKTKVTNDFIVLRKLLNHTYLYPRPCELPMDKQAQP